MASCAKIKCLYHPSNQTTEWRTHFKKYSWVLLKARVIAHTLRNEVGFSSFTRIFRPTRLTKDVVLRYVGLKSTEPRLFVADRPVYKKAKFGEFPQSDLSATWFDKNLSSIEEKSTSFLGMLASPPSNCNDTSIKFVFLLQTLFKRFLVMLSK